MQQAYEAPVAAFEAPEPIEEAQADLGFELPHPVEAEIVRPVTRIVDPMVEDEPLFAEPRFDSEPRTAQKSGFFSMFGGGRPRYDAPPAQPAAPPQSRAPVNGHPASAPLAIEEPQAEGEDLEIPSFLRRLAN
jgi:cell division protein FtsZ